MDQSIEALMGLIPPESSDQQALANQLRGQRQMGDFYSLSPTLKDYGQQKSKTALNTARTAGDNRQKGLTRSRQAERDKFAEQKHADSMIGYSDIREMQDTDGKYSTWGQNKRTGQFEKIPGMEGLKEPQTSYTSSVFRTMNVPGLKEAGFRMNDAGHIMAPDGKIYEKHEDFAKAFPDFAGQALENIRAKAQEGQRGTDTAKEIQTRLDSHVETGNRLSGSQQQLGDILSAIEAGATSGNVADMFMTVDNATAQLESALSNLTLDSLTQYKLTPVSDKDLEYVRKGAAPNLTADGLKRWATHKNEAVGRMLEANQFMEDWVAQNERVPRGDDRKYVEKQVDKILHDDGFEFAFDLDAEEKRDAAFNQAEKVTFKRPNFVTQSDWDSYTPEQQKQLGE